MGDQDRLGHSIQELDSSQRPTILVVDDDEALQIFILKILQKEYDVVDAADAVEAMAIIDRGNVDLVLLDLMLPGVSGVSLCRSIKARQGGDRIPVIILTARTDLESKLETLEAGAEDYVTKPFHPRELLMRIKVQLRVKQLHQEIIKSERLKAIVETAVTANHEINNPLCAIITNAELLKSRPAMTDDRLAAEFLDRIVGNAEHIEATLQKMANLIQPVISEYMPGLSMLDISHSASKEGG